MTRLTAPAKVFIGVTAILALICVSASLARYFGLFHGGQSRANACRDNLNLLGVEFQLYAQDRGRLPHHDRWVTELAGHSRRSLRGLRDALKCPSDESTAAVSYEMNRRLSGRRIEDIPTGVEAKTVLLSEKPFPGNHGFRLYLDRHVARVRRARLLSR